MAESGIDLSVVLVNYNGAKCLPKALVALSQNTQATDVECIVVDSGSSDGSWRDVSQHWDKARAIRFEENIGFCAGCNRGAEAAKGRYVAFVNFDGEVEGGWDLPLRNGLADEEISVTGGLLLRPDGETLEAAGLAIAPNTATYGRLENHPRASAPNEPFEVAAVSGALMMVRRSDFLALGGFYESIWMYGEEADYCLRVPGRVVIHPDSAIRHEMGHAAGPRHSTVRLYWPSRNRLINAARHLPGLAMAKSVITSAVFDLFTLAQLRSYVALSAISKGWWDGLRAIGSERNVRTPAERKHAATKIVSLGVALRQQRELIRTQPS